MKPFWIPLLLAQLAIPTWAMAQGNDSPSAAAASQGNQKSDAVQVGAGSKGDVTAGASGPQGDVGAGIAPLPSTLAIVPPIDPFYGPGELPIEPPGQFHCDIIADAAAKSRCEDVAAHANGG